MKLTRRFWPCLPPSGALRSSHRLHSNMVGRRSRSPTNRQQTRQVPDSSSADTDKFPQTFRFSNRKAFSGESSPSSTGEQHCWDAGANHGGDGSCSRTPRCALHEVPEHPTPKMAPDAPKAHRSQPTEPERSEGMPDTSNSPGRPYSLPGCWCRCWRSPRTRPGHGLAAAFGPQVPRGAQRCLRQKRRCCRLTRWARTHCHDGAQENPPVAARPRRQQQQLGTCPGVPTRLLPLPPPPPDTDTCGAQPPSPLPAPRPTRSARRGAALLSSAPRAPAAPAPRRRTPQPAAPRCAPA